jgi:hypothetical protein
MASPLSALHMKSSDSCKIQVLSCYYGINERIKDIDNRIEGQDRIAHSGNRNIVSRQTYFVGGEAYGLMQKQKLVLEELRRRNIKP